MMAEAIGSTAARSFGVALLKPDMVDYLDYHERFCSDPLVHSTVIHAGLRLDPVILVAVEIGHGLCVLVWGKICGVLASWRQILTVEVMDGYHKTTPSHGGYGYGPDCNVAVLVCSLNPMKAIGDYVVRHEPWTWLEQTVHHLPCAQCPPVRSLYSLEHHASAYPGKTSLTTRNHLPPLSSRQSPYPV